jgi:hypothetical protein
MFIKGGGWSILFNMLYTLFTILEYLDTGLMYLRKSGLNLCLNMKCPTVILREKTSEKFYVAEVNLQ